MRLVARLLAGTAALNCMGETKLVGRAAPFRFTVDWLTKFAPATVMGVSGEPAASTDGEMELSDGCGLFTVNLTELECPPPGAGLLTTTGKFPAAAWSLALSETVSCVELTNVAACA